MASNWQVVRVFIISTFRDMHAERDHIVTVVLPELRERVEPLALEFFDTPANRWIRLSCKLARTLTRFRASSRSTAPLAGGTPGISPAS